MDFEHDISAGGFPSRRYVCNKCGAIMEFEDEQEDILICTNCDHSVDLDDYGSENEEIQWNALVQQQDIPPEGCSACGGPYPDCTSSCNLFDD